MKAERVWKKRFDPKRSFQSSALCLSYGIYKVQLLRWGILHENMYFQMAAFRLSPGARRKSQDSKARDEKALIKRMDKNYVQ